MQFLKNAFWTILAWFFMAIVLPLSLAAIVCLVLGSFRYGVVPGFLVVAGLYVGAQYAVSWWNQNG